MNEQVKILSPNLDSLLLECIANIRLDSSLIPDYLQVKLLKIIEGKSNLDKVSYDEKIFILSTMGVHTYNLTIKQDKDLGVRVIKDLLYGLKNDFTHRQIVALKKMDKIDMVVISDKDIVRNMEAIYFIQNKNSLKTLVKDYVEVRKSKVNKLFISKQKEEKVFDDIINFVVNSKLVENKVMLESKLSKNQYSMMMILYSKGSILLRDLFSQIDGSAKKKYYDARILENRALVKYEKLENKKTQTAIITTNGRMLIFNLIKKHFNYV